MVFQRYRGNENTHISNLDEFALTLGQLAVSLGRVGFNMLPLCL